MTSAACATRSGGRWQTSCGRLRRGLDQRSIALKGSDMAWTEERFLSTTFADRLFWMQQRIPDRWICSRFLRTIQLVRNALAVRHGYFRFLRRHVAQHVRLACAPLGFPILVAVSELDRTMPDRSLREPTCCRSGASWSLRLTSVQNQNTRSRSRCRRSRVTWQEERACYPMSEALCEGARASGQTGL